MNSISTHTDALRPRTRFVLAAAGAALVAGAGCGSAPDREPVADAEIARAQSVLIPLKQQLMGALKSALETGGPERAIEACRVQAPEIARSVAGESVAGEGVALGRTSHRLRNPANAPRPWVEPLLAEYAAGPADLGPRATRLANGRVGYVEPIRVKSMCLPCHGSTVPPPVAARLQELYPDDQATGFAEGDFRGLFWLELDPQAAPAPAS